MGWKGGFDVGVEAYVVREVDEVGGAGVDALGVGDGLLEVLV